MAELATHLAERAQICARVGPHVGPIWADTSGVSFAPKACRMLADTLTKLLPQSVADQSLGPTLSTLGRVDPCMAGMGVREWNSSRVESTSWAGNEGESGPPLATPVPRRPTPRAPPRPR